LDIENEFKGKIRTSYGIGTFLTNDIPGVKPLNMVIKISDVLVDDKWIPAIKLSDDVGKHTGNPEMIEIAKKILSFKYFSYILKWSHQMNHKSVKK
jgi:nicotinate phosphoribosyltransferase